MHTTQVSSTRGLEASTYFLAEAGTRTCNACLVMPTSTQFLACKFLACKQRIVLSYIDSSTIVSIASF